MKSGLFNYPLRGNGLGGVYNFPRQGNLRRLALRDAAEQTRQLKAFVRQVCPAPAPATVAHDVRSGRMDLGELSRRLDPSMAAPITDISQFGTTWCSKHQLTTVGNFCAGCEQDAADARVPVRKSVASVQSVVNDSGRLVTDGAEGVSP